MAASAAAGPALAHRPDERPRPRQQCIRSVAARGGDHDGALTLVAAASRGEVMRLHDHTSCRLISGSSILIDDELVDGASMKPLFLLFMFIASTDCCMTE